MLPNSLKSALVPFFARIPRRTGWRGEWRYGLLNDLRVLDSEVLPLMVQQFAALGLPPGATLPTQLPVPRLVVDHNQANSCREKFSLHAELPILALCPGAEFGGATSQTASIDGIVYRIEGGSNLADFDAVISEVQPALQSGLPALSEGWSYRTFRHPNPIDSGTRGFLRTTIELAPSP